MEINEYSVYWFDPDGISMKEKGPISAEEAVKAALGLIRRPAALIGVIRRVIVTDGDDYTCFCWEFEKGIVFPEKESR